MTSLVEEGINHLWTLSALQLHPWALIVVDEDATAGMSPLHLSLSLDSQRTAIRAPCQDREVLQIHRARPR